MNNNDYNSIYGLIFNCPFKDEIDSCPLKKIRQQNIEDRLALLEEVSEEEINTLLKQHFSCVKRREKS